MTRKDYELIAATIRRCDISYADTDEVARTFAADLAQTNPRFDPDRFLEACGTEVVHDPS